MSLLPRALAATCLFLTATVLAAPPRFAIGDAKRVGDDAGRSYPPSCLSVPLPSAPRGPVVTRTITLGNFDNNYSEPVAVSVWRAGCSGGRSAVLVRFDRIGGRENTAPFPSVPGPSVVRSGQNDLPLRIVAEPNTRLSDAVAVPLFGDGTLVLEQIQGLTRIDLDGAFTLAFDTVVNGQPRRETFNIAAYAPASHPDGFTPLEITGYLTGSWYDPAHTGEGIFFEVGERTNGQRFVFFAWFTYRPDGTPHWLVGNADVTDGSGLAIVPTLSFTGGGFAGAFGPAATGVPWGNVSFTFLDCDTMRLSFASSHSITGVPAGQGDRLWRRLSSINGFGCR